MTDSAYKSTTLAKSYVEASPLAVSDPSLLKREPFAHAMRAQDSILAGRRVLVSQHGGGPYEFLVDSTATGGVTQTKPDATTWRVIARARTELMPGSVMTARVLAVPSGASELFVAGTGTYENVGNYGGVRLSVAYIDTAGIPNTDTAAAQFQLDAAEDADGAEDTVAGDAWAQLRHYAKIGVQPSAAGLGTPSEVAQWSEWPTVTVAVEHRGGARVVHASLAEEAYKHVVGDTVYESTVNGVPANEQLVDRYPVEEIADGTTYDDHRLGVHRLLYVAQRQTLRVGPRICHWSAYSEAWATITDTEATALDVTTTTPARLSWRDSGAQTAWDADAPGFDLPQSMSAPQNLSTRLDGAGVSPVRLRVYARYSGAGSALGYLRVQTSARSWLDLEIDQAVVGTTWTWLDVTGWLETAIAGDDDAVVAQDWAWTASGTLQIRYWDLSYGEFVTGA